MCEGGGGEKENLGAGEMAQQLESGCSSKHSGFNSSTHIFAHNNICPRVSEETGQIHSTQT